MQSRLTLLILFLAIAVSLQSCKKDAGIGGTSTITGVVYTDLYAPNGDKLERQLALDKKVFIVYGDNVIFNDESDTHSNGQYQFKFLQKGTYTIFAYSDCDSCDSEQSAVSVTVEITDNKSELTAKDIILTEQLERDDGTASIIGKVYVKNFNPSGVLNNSYYVGNERVFIKYEDDDSYYEDKRTNPDGTYRFDQLLPGNYTVFAYSNCDTLENSSTYTSCEKAVYRTGEIVTPGQEKILSDLIIFK